MVVAGEGRGESMGGKIGREREGGGEGGRENTKGDYN